MSLCWAVWEARPEVVGFRAACVEYATASGLKFDSEGFNELFDFACGWMREHGHLPESGIPSGY